MRINYYAIFINTMLLCGILGAGCKISEQAELDIHRPRIKELWSFFKKGPDKMPLTGIFVDVKSNATSPDGKTWEMAFKTIQSAIDFCSAKGSCNGKDIIVAAGTYKRPKIIFNNKHKAIRLVGGYKSGEKYERVREFKYDKPDEWAVLDGDSESTPLVIIEGSERITFAGGFKFTNINVLSGIKGTSAMVIKGEVNKPAKHIIIQHSLFNDVQNSWPADKGGAIFAQYVSDLRLENVDAFGNMAAIEGGAFYFSDIDDLTILGGTWENNEAQGGNAHGGAAYFTNVTKLKMEGQVIKNNNALYGGGLYLTKISNETIGPLRLEGHKEYGYGLGMNVTDCDKLTLLGISLVNNKNINAGALGGGILVSNSRDITLDFTGAEVRNNHTYEGGVINIDGFPFYGSYGFYGYSSRITIKNGLFKNNESSNGGAIWAENTSNLTIDNMQFVGHKAGNGGAVYLSSPIHSIAIINTKFIRGTATKNAGGLYVTTPDNGGPLAKILVKDCVFKDNQAVGNGGAFLAEFIMDEVKVEGTLFEHNTSNNFGGSLAFDGRKKQARFIIGEHTQFFENESMRSAGGGAMYVTFNPANGAAAGTPQPDERQLVFYNINSDQQRNIAGKGMAGNFLRVGKVGIASITDTDFNSPPPPGTRTFLNILDRFIAYSNDSIDATALWNQLRLNWNAEKDVYAW